jgi:hypothetical protein
VHETALSLAEFFGVRPGRAVGDEGQLVDLVPTQIGSLAVPSGRLGAVDPFASLDSPLEVQVDPGVYPVILRQATCPSDDDTEFSDAAYLSLVLADAEPVSVEPALGTWVDATLYGVTTYGGGVGLVDALAAASQILPPESPEFEAWTTMAGQHPQGVLDATLPWAAHGENVIGVMSPSDDGEYPLYVTRDASGNPLAVHVDFLVVGEGRYQLDVHEWPPSPEVPAIRLKAAPTNHWT